MQALILAGGEGERLRPLTNKIPKPLLPIQGKPFLHYQLEYLKKQGIKEVILSLGYQGKKIKDYFMNNVLKDINIKYIQERKPLGTGGAVKYAEKWISRENCIIWNGDTFLEVDLKKMLKFHKEKKSDITIAIYWVKNATRYGTIKINKNSKILSFEEKRKQRKAFINGGVYIIKKKILKSFPNKNFSIEKDIFPKFLNKIWAFKTKGYFLDIGTFRSYAIAQKEFVKIYKKILSKNEKNPTDKQ